MPISPHPTSPHPISPQPIFPHTAVAPLAFIAPALKLIVLISVFALANGMLAQSSQAQPVNIDAPKKAMPEQLINITRDAFLAYKDINDFIAQSPVVTRLAPPDLNDIATHGPDVVKVIQGADCNRDGEVDTHKQCVKAFYDLWVRFNR